MTRPGVRPAYAQMAEALGRSLAAAGLKVIYGGGHVGLMGAVADAAMAAGGEVVGLIPTRLLEREVRTPAPGGTLSCSTRLNNVTLFEYWSSDEPLETVSR